MSFRKGGSVSQINGRKEERHTHHLRMANLARKEGFEHESQTDVVVGSGWNAFHHDGITEFTEVSRSLVKRLVTVGQVVMAECYENVPLQPQPSQYINVKARCEEGYQIQLPARVRQADDRDAQEIPFDGRRQI